MLANKHSCILTPTLFAPGSALTTYTAFSKAVVEVLEVIGNFAVPTFSLIQFSSCFLDLPRSIKSAKW